MLGEIAMDRPLRSEQLAVDLLNTRWGQQDEECDLLASLDGLQLANSRLVFAMARNAGWRPRPSQDHRVILQALRARNIEQACSLLARHIQTIERLALPAA